MSLVGFSSILDLSGHGTDYNDFVTGARETPYLKTLYDALFSAVSYQSIFTEGVLDESPSTAYVYADSNQLYGYDAIQSIDGTYYPFPPAMGRIELLDKLGLIAVAPAGANVNETFASVLNGYQYILTEYANAVDLLPRLERFKQTFKC